jgi:hypothetical protein
MKNIQLVFDTHSTGIVSFCINSKGSKVSISCNDGNSISINIILHPNDITDSNIRNYFGEIKKRFPHDDEKFWITKTILDNNVTHVEFNYPYIMMTLLRGFLLKYICRERLRVSDKTFRLNIDETTCTIAYDERNIYYPSSLQGLIELDELRVVNELSL